MIKAVINKKLPWNHKIHMAVFILNKQNTRKRLLYEHIVFLLH